MTTYEASKTGAFQLEVTTLTGVEAAEARRQARISAFADSPPAEQKKIIAEFTTELTAKGGDKLTVKDAQAAIELAMEIPESEACTVARPVRVSPRSSTARPTRSSRVSA